MKKSSSLLRCAIPLAAMLLSGCSMTTVGQANRAINGDISDASNYLQQAAMPLAPVNTDTVQENGGVWTSATAHRSENGQPLPYRFESPGVTITDSRPLTLFEIGSRITETTGIPVVFSPDVTAPAAGAATAGGASDAAAAPGAPPSPSSLLSGAAGPSAGAGGMPANITALFKQASLPAAVATPFAPVKLDQSNVKGGDIVAASDEQQAMKLDFSGGPLSQVLNRVSGYFGVSWSYDGQNIRFFRNVTRTYFIHALPLSSMTMSNSTDASSTSSGGSSGGQSTNAASSGSTQSAKTDVQIKVWDDIESGIKGIMNGVGEMSSSHSTGTITITAPAQLAAQVQSFIDGQNAILSKQVTISVEVLNLQMTDTDAVNFSLSGLFNQAAKYGLSVGTAGGVGAATATAGQMLAFNLSSTNGGFANSAALLQALSSKGRVSVVTRTSLTTLNGIPAPLQVTHTQGYLASITTTDVGSNATGSAQTSLQPGTVTYGYNLSLLPQVQPDSRSLVLSFSVNLSDLDGQVNGFDQFTSGGNTIQEPNIISRDFTQQAEVPNGSTLVLTGFEQTSASSNKSGTGSADFLGLGGNQNGSRVHSILVILLTPTVVSHSYITSSN